MPICDAQKKRKSEGGRHIAKYVSNLLEDIDTDV